MFVIGCGLDEGLDLQSSEILAFNLTVVVGMESAGVGAKRLVGTLSALEVLILTSRNVASINVRGGLDVNSGELESLIFWAEKKRLGVVAIQETMSLGVQEKVVRDHLGGRWSLHTGGGGQCEEETRDRLSSKPVF